jgi:hypothetical protein
MLPELFNQLALDQSALVCSDQQCLILLGNLIGAAAVLGGSITTTGKQTTIELNLVDVSGKRTINNVLLTSVAKKSDFFENELPALVKNLLSSRANTSPLASKSSVKHKSVLSNPLLYTGALLVGGAAATRTIFWYIIRVMIMRMLANLLMNPFRLMIFRYLPGESDRTSLTQQIQHDSIHPWFGA